MQEDEDEEIDGRRDRCLDDVGEIDGIPKNLEMNFVSLTWI